MQAWALPSIFRGGTTLKETSSNGNPDMFLLVREQPYFEEDQYWRLLIWAVDDAVYIASGNEDEAALYDTFLSFPVMKYRNGWPS
jgi:hypothetical protein